MKETASVGVSLRLGAGVERPSLVRPFLVHRPVLRREVAVAHDLTSAAVVVERVYAGLVVRRG